MESMKKGLNPALQPWHGGRLWWRNLSFPPPREIHLHTPTGKMRFFLLLPTPPPADEDKKRFQIGSKNSSILKWPPYHPPNSTYKKEVKPPPLQTSILFGTALGLPYRYSLKLPIGRRKNAMSLLLESNLNYKNLALSFSEICYSNLQFLNPNLT